MSQINSDQPDTYPYPPEGYLDPTESGHSPDKDPAKDGREGDDEERARSLPDGSRGGRFQED